MGALDDELTTPDVLLRLFFSLVTGLMIGLERDMTGHAAGLRTHILVCIGSALFTVCGSMAAAEVGGPVDPTRMAAQVRNESAHVVCPQLRERKACYHACKRRRVRALIAWRCCPA
jgi:MgtC family